MHQTAKANLGELVVTDPADNLRIGYQPVTDIFRSIFENALDGILLTNDQGVILLANQSVMTMLGYTREQILRMELADLISADAVSRIMKQSAHGTVGKCRVSSVSVKRRDSTCFYADVNTSIIKPDGQKYLLHIIRDVTEQTNVQERINRLAKFPDENPAPVFRVAANGRLLYGNKASEPLLNHLRINERGCIIGEWMDHVTEVLHAEVCETLEVECGDVVYDLTFTPISQMGYVNVYGMDITQRKEMAEELKVARDKAQRMLKELKRAQQSLVRNERLSALKEMASGIVHDFRNVLMLMQCGTEFVLSSDNIESYDKEVIHYCRDMDLCVQDATTIINRLSSFYSDEPENEMVPLNISRVMKVIIRMVRKTLASRSGNADIQITIKDEIDQNIFVEGCESELREAFTNFLNNSIDAIKDRGTITVTVSKEHEVPKVTISDTGMGMTDEVKQKCLQPFFTTKGEKGTGMGLAVTYGIIQRHNGEIEVDSSPGIGTAITIYFGRRKKKWGSNEIKDRTDMVKKEEIIVEIEKLVHRYGRYGMWIIGTTSDPKERRKKLSVMNWHCWKLSNPEVSLKIQNHFIEKGMAQDVVDEAFSGQYVYIY
ncbi:hypothetical protein BVX97_03030 [bacterium E08(2017)]|nr:hypothetical protein BVX97_03030 [bacterium E08(2017)]